VVTAGQYPLAGPVFAETFDPRLMWDAAAEYEPEAMQAGQGLVGGD